MLFFSCSSDKDLVFDKLVGTWRLEGRNEFERWTKNHDGSFTSVMFSVNDKDTVFSETVKIFESTDSEWIFETLVQNQNNGRAVQFKSVLLNPTQIIFENLQHDFPKSIHYSVNETDKLNAFIAGKGDTIQFNFTRIVK